MIKSGPQGETAYVNQFYVVRNSSVATKHIFAGGSRLASKLASQPDEDGNTTTPTPGNSGQVPWGWSNGNGNGNAGGNSGSNGGGAVFEKDQYFFHPDHLGSSSYVTDVDGEIFQHIEYFPFGETFYEESSNTQRTPYLFTGKELDEETGLYYFGARYYDPRTSVWQSPDPILASYMRGQGSGGGVFTPVNLNLYGYVQQRPVVAIDPDGNDAMLITFPEYKAAGIPFTGHAAAISIDEDTGHTRYYEYGRYDPDDQGWVMRRGISDLEMIDGMPSAESMGRLLSEISEQSGKGSFVAAEYHSGADDLDAMHLFAETRKGDNNNSNREPYRDFYNNCYSFSEAMISEGYGGWLGTIKRAGEYIDPRLDWPTGRQGFDAVYSPDTNTLTGNMYFYVDLNATNTE